MFKGGCSTARACGICKIDLTTFLFGFSAWQMKIHVFQTVGSNATFDHGRTGDLRCGVKT